MVGVQFAQEFVLRVLNCTQLTVVEQIAQLVQRVVGDAHLFAVHTTVLNGVAFANIR